MIEFAGRGILLDIEGTTSSVSFVYDVMFPYARRQLEDYLRDNWGSAELNEACRFIARDAGFASLEAWSGGRGDGERLRQLVRDEVIRLMDADAKATGLKQLQGLIWRAGFDSGALRAHLFDDVPPALGAWQAAGRDVRIYSSGSVTAQKLFFGHTIAGNLLDLFQGFYDTTTGPKKEAASYEKIAAEFGFSATQIIFLSDVAAELNAARAAGLQTALCRRLGNAPVAPGHGHPEITDFREIRLVDGGERTARE